MATDELKRYGSTPATKGPDPADEGMEYIKNKLPLLNETTAEEEEKRLAPDEDVPDGEKASILNSALQPF